MLRTVVILSIAFNALLCNAQFISFNDGKFGVNFGGYHAEAGLGGLLTGNAAHGGLSASAGTPYGQRASAGIGGATGGNSQGGAYASASAGGNVGASAGLGAIAGGDAGLGAEAHTGPLTASASGAGGTGFQVSTNKRIPASAVIQNSAAAADYNGNTNVIYRFDGGEFDGNVQAATNNNVVKETHIQRIRPPKKFNKINAQGHAHVAQPSNVNKQIDTRFGIVQQANNINSDSEASIDDQDSVVIDEKQQHKRQQENIVEVEKQQQNVATASASASVVPNARINIQKSINYNKVGGVSTASVVAPLSQPQQQQQIQYVQPAFVTYRKHIRPWRRIHYRKQVVPVIYEQPQNVQIVEKAVVPVAPQQVIVTKEVEATPVVRTKVISKTKTIQPAVVYQPVAPPPSVYTGVGYTKTKSVGVGGAGGGAGAATLSGNFNSQGLFDSIFNIPIQTLKAVNGLVNNVAGGVSGNIAVSKSVSASGSY